MSARHAILSVVLVVGLIGAIAMIFLSPTSKIGANCATRTMTTRALALGFAPGAAYGKGLDNEDGSAAFNACLNDTSFGYDGRDLWVLVKDARIKPVHIRGTFEGDYFVRPGATTLDRLFFLDRELAMTEVSGRVAADVAATLGTPDDDTLTGRPNEEDFLKGDLGSDIYIISRHSGSNTIDLEGNAPDDRDTLRFDFQMQDVFQRTNPQPDVWETDQAIEFLETRKDEDGTVKTYLSPQRIIVKNMYPKTQWAESAPSVRYVFEDGKQSDVAIARLRVMQFPFLRADAKIGRLRNGPLHGNDLQLMVEDRSYFLEGSSHRALLATLRQAAPI